MKIGIDLGGSHIAIGVVDNQGRIIEKQEKRLLKKDKENIKKVIEEYIVQTVERFEKDYKITEIGIAIPGTVANGMIIKSVNLGIENYNIVDKLNEKLNYKIKIKNDAKCAAIAENEYGSLKKYKRAIFITLGTGIGGAVIINNELLDTGKLPGCEIGHMVVENDGVLCNCGRKGCFEKYASMKVFKNNLRKELNLDEKTSGKDLLNIIRESSKNKESKKYKVIEKVINKYINYLALGLANLINIFEPEAIGIGGSFVYFEEELLGRLKEKLLEKNMLFNPRENIVIETAILGNDAGIIGSTI